ncbi:hypothetical protein NFI96_006764 [Prochilodus magdalenae]|nr:hypothetical protein NFI96_006764 [Prochilodus magdalenae]
MDYSLDLYTYRVSWMVSGADTVDRTFSELRLTELDAVGELTKPDFVTNPHLYFGRMWESFTPTPPPPPETKESLKAAFDEKSLFPKEVLEQVDRPPGTQRHAQRVSTMRSYGRVISRSLGKPKASTSGAAKAKSAQEQCVELHGMGFHGEQLHPSLTSPSAVQSVERSGVKLRPWTLEQWRRVLSGGTNHASSSGNLMDESGFGGTRRTLSECREELNRSSAVPMDFKVRPIDEDCHGGTQNGSGSSSVTSPTLVLVETPNESVCGGTVVSTKMNGLLSHVQKTWCHSTSTPTAPSAGTV